MLVCQNYYECVSENGEFLADWSRFLLAPELVADRQASTSPGMVREEREEDAASVAYEAQSSKGRWTGLHYFPQFPGNKATIHSSQ